MSKRKKGEEDLPQLQPPWRLIRHRQEKYYYNCDTKEVIWPNQFSARFGNSATNGNSKNSKVTAEVTNSKAVVRKLPEFHTNNAASTSDSVEPMEVDYVNEVLHAFRKDCKDYNGNLDKFTNKRLAEIDYRNTRNNHIIVFDTCSLLHDPLIVRKTGTAKIKMRIPYTVLCELDGLKKSEKLRVPVNSVLRDLLATYDTSPDLVSFENSVDSRLPFILKSEICSQSAPFVATTADERILKSALMLKEHVNKPSMNIVLVSNDCNLRAKARAHDLSAVDNAAFSTKYLEPLKKMKAEKSSSSNNRRGRTMHRRSDPPLLPPYDEDRPDDRKRRRMTEPISQHSSKNRREDMPTSRNSRPSPRVSGDCHLHSKKDSHSSARYPDEPYRRNNQYKSNGVPPSVSTQMNHNPSHEITSWYYPEKIKAFLFQTELKKFQYMLRVSVQRTLESANYNLEQPLFKLCDTGYRFIMNGFKEEDLSEFILQLEELYEESVAHLNEHQKIERTKLIEELISDGVGGEGIEAIKDCAEQVKEKRGWSPLNPTPSVVAVTSSA